MPNLRSSRSLLVVALLLATVLVVLLGAQVRKLRVDLRSVQERAGLLAPGMYVPRLELMSLDGSSATIGESVTGAHEILFLYNTTCPFCRAIMPVWKQVADRALNAGSSVHGLSVDGVAETARYSREHELNFPTLILATDRTRALLGARAVPQTLVIDPEGRVVASWMGGLSPVVIDSLLDFARIQSRVD